MVGVKSLLELVERTKKVSSGFPNKYDKRSRLIDLVEEVGELAQAVHIVEGFKKTNDPAKTKTKVDVADAICDILYELVLLADDYSIDLEMEYVEMLGRLEKRIKEGEFH